MCFYSIIHCSLQPAFIERALWPEKVLGVVNTKANETRNSEPVL